MSPAHRRSIWLCALSVAGVLAAAPSPAKERGESDAVKLFADAEARRTGEAAPAFKAADLLPRELLRGAHYVIEDEVTVRDYRYLFHLRTAYGRLPALGMNMLALRLREMHALDRAIEISGDPQFVTGILNSLRQTPEGALLVISDPVGTLFRAPEGVKRILSSHLDARDRRAGSATRRRFAIAIGCDPETSNPVLKRFLDQIALRKGLGEIAGRAGLSLLVPGLGLLPTTSEIHDIVAAKSPREILADIDAELSRMGVAASVRERFLELPTTTTQKLLFVLSLRELRGVEQRHVLVTQAIRARDESEALGHIHQLQQLVALHRKPGIERVFDLGLPVAQLTDRRIVAVAAFDYLPATDEALRSVARLRQSFPESAITLQLQGRASERIHATLAAAKITLVERAPVAGRQEGGGEE